MPDRGNADAESVGLMWFRTGLRLQDNAPLYAALRDNAQVACLYVLDDVYMRGPDIGAARAAFLLESLKELDTRLREQGGRLIVRRSNGDTPEQVVRFAREIGAGRIYISRDYLPYPIARDRKTSELAREQEIELRVFRDLLLVDPTKVLTAEERPYTVFTPFKRRWENMLRTPARLEIEPLLSRLHAFKSSSGIDLPSLSDYGLHLKQQIETPGETKGYARLQEFMACGLPVYHQNRDFCADPESTSRLSMHIKWGTVSIRDCYREARKAGGPGADKWIDELAWREFFHGILLHFPHALTGPMLPEYADFPWSDNREHLEAWKAGETGYPLVDAGMRQMNATGWMHNRLRQVVGSYLCKDLNINWQEGERYFMQMLVDGDWPANNGGWQWIAGCGTDPRRATRIFNPTLQMERYDPKAEYVRQWLPEYGTKRYRDPIVDHETGRRNFLERFQSTSGERQRQREARREENKARKPSRHNASDDEQPELF